MAGKQIVTKVMTDADEDAAATSLLNANREAAQPRPGTQQQQQADPEVEYEIVDPADEAEAETEGEREESLVDEQDEPGTGRREGRLEDRIAREEEEARKKGVSRSTLRRQKARETRIAKDVETERLRNDLARMQAQVEELQGFRTSTEPRLSEFDVARKRDFISNLDSQIADAQTVMERHEAAFSQALADGDSAGAAKALRAQQEAFVKRERLASQKTIAEQQATRADTTEQAQRPGTQQQQQRPQRSPDPVADDLGRQFLRENPWINVKGGDDDSDLVRLLDGQVERAGYKPNTQAYWDELRKRAEKHLPHRFEEDEEDDDGEQPQPRRQARNGNGNGNGQQQRAGNGQQQRRGPMTAGSGEGAGQVRKQKVVLSAARKEQLQLAGAIDHSGKVIDPARFESYLKSYVKFDRENAAA